MIESDPQEFMRQLAEHVKARNVRAVRHPYRPLTLYSYAACVQYDRLWDDVTRRTRGLILHDNGEIVANPFPKFFNLSEHDLSEIPTGRFEVFDKVDGSLGISYLIDGIPHIATRGSFTSEQAEEATKMLWRDHNISQMDPTLTYLFEIVYPGNRIVVDYGERRELVLLGARERMTGEEIPLDDIQWDGSRAEKFNETRLEQLTTRERPNCEGYVVRFESGLRVKIKHAEYLRLHKLLTCTTARMIWEELKSGRDMRAFLMAVPDEFTKWVESVAENLTGEFCATEGDCQRIFDARPNGDRREIAEYFLRHKSIVPTGALFAMLDGKPYREMIWKELKPEHDTPFMSEAEAE